MLLRSLPPNRTDRLFLSPLSSYIFAPIVRDIRAGHVRLSTFKFLIFSPTYPAAVLHRLVGRGGCKVLSTELAGSAVRLIESPRRGAFKGS